MLTVTLTSPTAPVDDGGTVTLLVTPAGLLSGIDLGTSVDG